MKVKKHQARKMTRNFVMATGLMLLVLSPIAVLAQDGTTYGKKMNVDKSAKKVTLSSGDFQLVVNAGGQVPFYHFNTTVTKFFFKFQKIIQYVDSNENGLYDSGEAISSSTGVLSLPSVSWKLTVLTNSDDRKEFSFTSESIRQPGFENVQIELVNHFVSDDPAVKFDVFISNWPFDPDATGLALEFELIWEEETNLVKETTDEAILLKDGNGNVQAYFEIVSSIIVDGNPVTNGAILFETATADKPKLNIYVNYPRFEASLEHDPTLGTSYSALGGETANPSAIFRNFFGELDLRNVIEGFVVLTALGSVALLSLMWINRKKRS